MIIPVHYTNIWVSEDDIGLWFLATCRDCSINLAPGTWLNTLHLLIQDKEDGINETVDTHGELFNGFFWSLLAEDVDSKPDPYH